MMKNRKLSFLAFAPLLMAFQCDEDVENTIVFNDYSVRVTEEADFSLNDTIWIEGKVSSQIYDIALADSAFTEIPQEDIFSIYRLIEPTRVSNSKDAIDQFELIFDIGNYSNALPCKNSQMSAAPTLSSNNSFYSYRIGIKPLTKGDFVISWQNAILKNQNRNESIVANYPIENMPNEIGFDQCGNVSWRILSESDKEYYFNVD